MKVEGYAVRFNDWTFIGEGFWEQVKPGAFSRTLRDKREKFLIHHHDYKTVLASTKSGTLRLKEDSVGLHFSADLPDTTAAHDLSELIKRRDISGMSFGFNVNGAEGEMWSERKDYQIDRELLDLNLFEVTITPIPAYKKTSVAVRGKSSKKDKSTETVSNADAAKRRIARKMRMRAKLDLMQKTAS